VEGIVRRLRSERPPRLAVLLCVVVAAVAAALRYPQALSDITDRARDNAALSFADREIGGGNSVLPGQEVMYQARARIPEDGSYEVVVGERSEGWPSLTQEHAAGFARYFLQPRRPAPGAPWVVCFNCGLGPESGRVVWEGEEGLSIIRRPE